MESPCFRCCHPVPPPRVRPAIPVWETTPAGTAGPKRLSLQVQFPKQDACLDASSPGVWVHSDPIHRTQVYDDASVTCGVAGEAVASSSNGREKPVLLSEQHGGADVSHFGTSDDECRIPVNGPVPDSPMVLIGAVAGAKDLTTD